MKRLLSVILCILFASLPSLATAIMSEEIGGQVDAIFKKSQTVGGALVVFRNGKIEYTRYYGYQDAENQIPATKNTYFRLASVTKMVTGIGLLQLREQGLLELDRDISDYFGYPIANTHYPDTPITLRQIMSRSTVDRPISILSRIESDRGEKYTARFRQRAGRFIPRSPKKRKNLRTIQKRSPEPPMNTPTSPPALPERYWKQSRT